ncbi:NAD(P)/FAD-dependent oxidoreductase [Spirillospora sp. NBC_01491]|uniref:NAD(P)/FAD-dependent oxidoreductase n=1 Tax=Spirillospora sp. NBC_01491 TaxID=2976007 RepID=UPI002E314B6B|nr:FAD-dependent oxidoreductase [Spirillospora sp. NBC_01491]
MRTHRRIVIAGASLAGLRAAQTLRDEGFAGELDLIGAEPHLPYNRPPLSKSVLTGDDDVALPGADEIDARWLGGRRAVRLDGDVRAVTLDDGTRLPYDGLVIATGARPRLPAGGWTDLPGVHVLRTIDDALALRAALAGGPRRVVVIGGGFIGGEIASTVRAQGIETVLVDAAPFPMAGVIGETAAGWLAGHHRRNGVDLVSGTRVTTVERTPVDGAPVDGGSGHEGTALRVRLDDGRSLPADLVVAGMGVLPNTEWLEGGGVRVDDGVLTDAALFAADGVVAAGDVARWPHGLFGGEAVRVEHWANANEQGAVAARNLLRGPAEAEPFTEVPSLGTRVHGVRVQWAGFPRLADTSRVVAGDPADGRFAVAFGRAGVLVGGAAVGLPKELIRLRRAIAAGEPVPALAG